MSKIISKLASKAQFEIDLRTDRLYLVTDKKRVRMPLGMLKYAIRLRKIMEV